MFFIRNLPDGASKRQRIFVLIVLCLLIASPAGAQNTSSVDLTFDAPVSRNQISTNVASAKLVRQPDGKILVFGNFNNIGSKSANKLTRLNQDGTVDNSFSCACNYFSVVNNPAGITSMVVQPDGKIILGGTHNGYPRLLVRLNADGSLDASFAFPAFDNLHAGSIAFAVQPDGKIFASVIRGGASPYTTLYRLNSDGSIDSSFSQTTIITTSASTAIRSVKVLPDGKIMVSARHPNYGLFFRLNSNGSQDTSFIAPVFTSPGNPAVKDFGVQSDGKIVIIGDWSRINNVNRPDFARLNADGSVDSKFTSGVSGGDSLAILSNDKILVDGKTRLNADGTVDNTFSPAYQVTSWLPDTSDGIIFAGSFTEGGETTQGIGRINSDGSSDGAFHIAPFGLSGEVTALAVQPDGKVLISGFYNRVSGVLRKGMARLNTDGSLDTSFDAGNAIAEGSIRAGAIIILPDGKILAGGKRLNPDGSIDSAFNPVTDSPILSVALQPDGKILIGGQFTLVNGASRTGFARLNSDGSLDTTLNPVIETPNILAIFVQPDGKS